MGNETWEELYSQRKEIATLVKRVGMLEHQAKELRVVIKEQGCPNWGETDDGGYGPCDDCAYCKLFFS